ACALHLFLFAGPASSSISTRSLHDALPILVPCSSLLAALPHGVAPLLEGMRLDGDFQLSASLEYDSTQPDAMESTLALSNRCRRSEEHTSELQSRENLVCRLLLAKKEGGCL